MAGTPVETAIGTAGLGIGVLMLWAALKNKSVFGPNGVLTVALTTGKFPDVSRVGTGVGAPGSTPRPSYVDAAIRQIQDGNAQLASEIDGELFRLESSETSNVSKVEGLLRQAHSSGFASAADTIESYLEWLIPQGIRIPGDTGPR